MIDDEIEDTTISLRGTVERVVFYNPDNGFAVVRVELDSTHPVRQGTAWVTAVGQLGGLHPGQELALAGMWEDHRGHGRQLRVAHHEARLPASDQGLRRYLGSGVVPGISDVLAGRIVATFGASVFDVARDDPGRLLQVPGIGPTRAPRVAAILREHRDLHEIMAALQSYGVSTSLAGRIYAEFVDRSVQVVRNEPYRLTQVWGIGFNTADQIARAAGIPEGAPERLRAGLLFAVQQAAQRDGHTLVARAALLESAAKLLKLDPEQGAGAALRTQLTALRESGELASAHAGPVRSMMVALPLYAEAEREIAERLSAMAARTPSHEWEKVRLTRRVVGRIVLTEEQDRAVTMAASRVVSILTGGPGTGKTETLNALLHALKGASLQVALAAPTGRAAKRMEEATGWPARTLHRLLEMRPDAAPGRCEDNPIDADMVVVDEVSMVDVLLMRHLLRAIGPQTHLLLVGDVDQLPSVGPGAALRDMVPADSIPTTRLTQLHRQAEGSGIAANARRALQGEPLVFWQDVEDCFFIPANTAAEAAQLTVELACDRLPRRYGLSAGDVQVLSPRKDGEAGIHALNRLLQERLNPEQPGEDVHRAGDRTFRRGDRVLQLENDYDLGVMNGDLGTVRLVDPDSQELLIEMDDGQEVDYPYRRLFELTHGWAITIHKAQGAEFPCVVIPLVMSHGSLLLSRPLLYTALTRAQRMVVIVGQERALKMALGNWGKEERCTLLGGLLDGTARLS